MVSTVEPHLGANAQSTCCYTLLVRATGLEISFKVSLSPGTVPESVFKKATSSRLAKSVFRTRSRCLPPFKQVVLHLIAVAEAQCLVDADLKRVVRPVEALGQVFATFLEVGQALAKSSASSAWPTAPGRRRTPARCRTGSVSADAGEPRQINRRRPLALRPLAVPGIGVTHQAANGLA